MKPTVVLVGHGSRAAGFAASMEKVARTLRSLKKFDAVLCAYLEIAPPSIEEAVDSAAKKGARLIKILPYFVLGGRHVNEDLPRIAAAARERHPQVRVDLCPYLGFDKKIVQVVQKRLNQKVSR